MLHDSGIAGTALSFLSFLSYVCTRTLVTRTRVRLALRS